MIEASRVHPAPAVCPFTYCLTATGLLEDADPSILVELRRDFSTWLGDHQRGDDAIAVTIELVTNALVHGSRPGGVVTLTVERLADAGLEVCVRDAGRAVADAPQGITPGLGRGLRIVEDLSERVELIAHPGGGLAVQAILAEAPPPVIEPEVDVEALLKAYPDGEDDGDDVTGGGDDVR